jgi:hypothetical protein
VLVPDSFAGKFASIRDVANRQMMDSGRKARNDALFWEQVHKAFIESGDLEYDCFNFANNKVFCERNP